MNLYFTEELEIAQGLRHQVRVTRVLHEEETEFQRIAIVETTDFGRMMVLDNVIMCTEFDEFCYHEMISHAALFAHPAPERVLVIGGGDGGTVREVLRHPGVQVDLCELDRRVVELSREYLPSLAGRLGDSRVSLNYADGAAWVKDRPDYYDVIIVDSTDPVGPARVLFEEEFYGACRNSLRENGILINQAENFLLHTDIIRELIGFGRKLFPVHEYYYAVVPTYPGGMIGFTFFSRGPGPFENNNYEIKAARADYASVLSELRYWSPEMHRAAFALPASVRRNLFG